MTKRLLEFFQQQDGRFDGVHLVYTLAGVSFCVLLLHIGITTGKVPEIPMSVVAALAVFAGAKLIQRPMENDVNNR